MIRPKNKAPQTLLMKALNVNSEDLEVNHAGQLSKSQRHQIRIDQILGALFWWGLALVGALPFIFPNQWRLTLTDALLHLVVIAVGLGMAFWRQYQTHQILSRNTVKVIFKPIKKTRHYGNKHWHHYMTAGGRKFSVSEDVYKALEEDRKYAVFFVPETERVVSIQADSDYVREKRLSQERSHDADISLTEDKEQQASIQ